MKHGSVGAVDEATFQLHMDYIHNPHNLFTACSILATHGFEDIDRRASIYRDITTLVQLRQQDAAWDECRRKLRTLVQSDKGEFFSTQRIRDDDDYKFRPLQTDEIQIEKENIRYAIHVLDDFFDCGAHTMSIQELSELSPTGCIGHFLGRCIGRKREGKPEQEQHV
ncbi:uncharacterized protein EV420DRAFT_1642927 [Desarmillaria tabescens]|uniref:Uncharacterized protein n=1 Tax=Armillaria tabescens TaxID=1929756 RepID=A0AA39KGW2_ARMTA|nr:uncharacterized protein EV420DRAFT_1642927 [Desarmillaria tabescens]KAK0458593.1 hypothetical protein EV420DRAFT_1642927 [Desarmillaria tabescens]